MSQPTLWIGLKMGAHNAFREIIPIPSQRRPIGSLQALGFHLLANALLLFMAHLARRPGTKTIRLLLLPAVVTAQVAAGFRFKWGGPSLNAYNWAHGLYAAFSVGKALDLGFSLHGRRLVGESYAGQVVLEPNEKLDSDDEISDSGTNAESTGQSKLTRHPPSNIPSFIPVWLSDACGLLFSMRGLGWDFGQEVHVPSASRYDHTSRYAFLSSTALEFLQHYLILDLLESTLKLFPGVGSPTGGSIFYADLPPFPRYILSTFLHIITGSMLIQGFGMVYSLVALLSVFFNLTPPISWPALFEDPWHSSSLHAFWARDWHQLLRRTFLIYGGLPAQWLFGDVGMLMGTFVASGAFHELTMYAMGRGLDWRTPAFFTGMGPLLIAERVWKRVTGRRVGGPLGRAWVYLVIFILGQPMIDSWTSRGLAGQVIIPSLFSPTRQILFPLLGWIYTYSR